MSRLSALLLGLAVVAVGGRSEACINDSELKTHEREFRSQYGGSNLVGVEPAENARRPVREALRRGAGAVLLVGAFGLATRRGRRAGA